MTQRTIGYYHGKPVTSEQLEEYFNAQERLIEFYRAHTARQYYTIAAQRRARIQDAQHGAICAVLIIIAAVLL